MAQLGKHTFLHNHPAVEKELGIDSAHVIVDKGDWLEILAFLENDDIISIEDYRKKMKIPQNKFCKTCFHRETQEDQPGDICLYHTSDRGYTVGCFKLEINCDFWMDRKLLPEPSQDNKKHTPPIGLKSFQALPHNIINNPKSRSFINHFRQVEQAIMRGDRVLVAGISDCSKYQEAFKHIGHLVIAPSYHERKKDLVTGYFFEIKKTLKHS